METNTSEPPFKCRKRRDAIKTRRESLAWDKSGRNLITDQTVTGMKVARTSHRLLYGTREPTPPMLMEKSKRNPVRMKVQMRRIGADQPVVAKKPPNSGGAKGLSYPVLDNGSTTGK